MDGDGERQRYITADTHAGLFLKGKRDTSRGRYGGNEPVSVKLHHRVQQG